MMLLMNISRDQPPTIMSQTARFQNLSSMVNSALIVQDRLPSGTYIHRNVFLVPKERYIKHKADLALLEEPSLLVVQLEQHMMLPAIVVSLKSQHAPKEPTLMPAQKPA